MTVTVSGGIVVRADEVVLTASGPAIPPAQLPRGTPVAVGPAVAGEAAGAAARELLSELVAAAGTVAADAGVDLGNGFRSARLDGIVSRAEGHGGGDRRDAVLAVLGVPRFAERLGPPAALLVALFGPEATRPLGAATLRAIDEGQWAVLRFAVAAAGVLGPEQVAEVLRLRAPRGVDPFPDGLASLTGAQLGVVLAPYETRRRLTLLTGLWERVCATRAAVQRRERLLGSQEPFRALASDLRERWAADENARIERAVGTLVPAAGVLGGPVHPAAARRARGHRAGPGRADGRRAR